MTHPPISSRPILWLDADAAPRDVKDICIRASDRLKLETILVANQRLQIPAGYTYVSAVRVDSGADIADGYIVESTRAGDVAITADVPLADRFRRVLLAALLVAKG